MESAKILKAIAAATLILTEQQDGMVTDASVGQMTHSHTGQGVEGAMERNLNGRDAMLETVAAATLSARRRQG